MLNKNKPHGMSSKEWNKKYPDLNADKFKKGGSKKKSKKTKKNQGGADLKVEFGNNPQFDLTPIQNLPFTSGEYTTASMGVVARDADTVNTAAPSEEYLSKEMKKRTKKMKSGFIHSPDPTNNLVQEAAYVAPGKLIAKAEVPVQRERHEPIIKEGKPVKYNTAGSKKKKSKRKISDEQRVKMARGLSDWKAFYAKLNKQPFMKNMKKGKMQAGSIVFEMKKDCDDSGCDIDFDEIIKCLNENLGGKDGNVGGVKFSNFDYPTYGVEDVITMMNEMRSVLAKKGARIPMESMKAKKMQKKLLKVD